MKFMNRIKRECWHEKSLQTRFWLKIRKIVFPSIQKVLSISIFLNTKIGRPVLASRIGCEVECKFMVIAIDKIFYNRLYLVHFSTMNKFERLRRHFQGYKIYFCFTNMKIRHFLIVLIVVSLLGFVSCSFLSDNLENFRTIRSLHKDTMVRLYDKVYRTKLARKNTLVFSYFSFVIEC